MKIKTKMAGLTGFAGLLWLGVTAVIAAGQRKLVFNPAVGRGGIGPRSSGHRTRSVVLRANDGTRLSGWLMKPAFPGPHRAVIYFGGRSEDVSWVAARRRAHVPRNGSSRCQLQGLRRVTWHSE